MGYDFFLPKREGGYWGMGLVDLVWKICATVVNCRIKRIVTLHNTLDGFRAGKGTGKERLRSKVGTEVDGDCA